MAYSFLKGHGTENDFVLLPDHDGSVHGTLSPEQWSARVRALCDRRAGIGGDGVLRVVRAASAGLDGGWFMDYWNADGSVSEMCGNGIRVFAQHLLEEGLVAAGEPLPVQTRDGMKTISFAASDGAAITVDMGEPRVLGSTFVTIGSASWEAMHVDVGNPHAVAFVESLAPDGPVGSLVDPPVVDPATYPDGVNVELVVPVGPGHVAMRVHERGSGETRSCGTGACAVAVAAAVRDGAGPEGTGRGSTYTVDLPGGTLVIEWTAEGRVLMTGPAVIVARGETAL